MATAQDIIDQAAGVLGVLGATGTLSTDDADKNTLAFKLMKGLMSEWAEDGLVAIPAPSVTTDTLEVPEGTERALVYNLAVEISPIFGKTPNAVTVGVSERTRDRLEADVDIDIQVDTADLAFASGGRYNVNTDT